MTEDEGGDPVEIAWPIGQDEDLLERFRSVDRVACDLEAGGEVFDCEIMMEGADVTRSVPSIKTFRMSGLQQFDMAKLSLDPFDVARDQEFSLDMADGSCSLRRNPKGNRALLCANEE